MAFNITLYQSNSARNVIRKQVSTIQTFSGTLKTDTSIIDPVILIECELSAVKNANYMSIPEFGRYYFINNIRSVRNGLVEFSCHVDVLVTFSDEIRSQTGIIKKQAAQWNLYLNDGSFKVYQNPIVLTKPFPNGFTTQEFVLAVAGL